ncbi:hypothetical protein K438DRAFT_1854319 [Mycena galopus ATCC 62051]|nr:hypothetical protein K438DRAFT_1854319 [Mycena galopus ATCC 62051]
MPAARRTSTTRTRDIASSDDIPIVVATRMVSRSPSKRKKHVEPDDVIEISSSDDEEPLPRKLPPREQLKEVQQKLRHKSSKLETVEGELERARKEISELKKASKHSGKVLLDTAQLEDLINCAICTTTNWTPYMLPCSHTFCKSCLVEWFNTCVAQHMAAHPHWRSNGQPPYHLLNPRIRAHPYIAAMVAAQGPQPDYSCPTCRAPVGSKPLEDYSLKAVIHTVATTAGETSPKKDPVVAKRRGKGKAKAVDGPFDGFFGKDS